MTVMLTASKFKHPWAYIAGYSHVIDEATPTQAFEVVSRMIAIKIDRVVTKVA
jgi:hypothetical protein